MVFPSDDLQSVLVGKKDVMVLIQLTTTDTTQSKPTGTLNVLDSAGRTVQTIALTQPSGPLLTAATGTPSFVTHYSANIDAINVVVGMKLKLSLANGQLTKEVSPRVGASNQIKLVSVPVNIAGVTGQVSDRAGEEIRLRTPIAKVTSIQRAVYTSSVSTFPADENAWSDAIRRVLVEIDALRVSDNADASSYYMGFVPKTTYGLTGIAYAPGHAAVVAAFTANQTVVLQTVVHEIGHNLNLSHAPCGNPAWVDPNYPYADAKLGAMGRYIWGYQSGLKTFVDPRRTELHDVMSYCDNTYYSYSDYNYRLIQKYMTPMDANFVTAPVQVANVQAAKQEVLLFSGVMSNGQMKLQPLKRFEGSPNGAGQGAFAARFTTATGVSEVLFNMATIDHDTQSSGFAFTVPNPGVLTGIEILRNGQSLFEQRAAPAKPSLPQGIAANAVAVLATERDGFLSLKWDPVAYPFLTVAHIGAQRTTLAFDLKGGVARLPLKGVSAGGLFELILSDGMNSTRVLQAR